MIYPLTTKLGSFLLFQAKNWQNHLNCKRVIRAICFYTTNISRVSCPEVLNYQGQCPRVSGVGRAVCLAFVKWEKGDWKRGEDKGNPAEQGHSQADEFYGRMFRNSIWKLIDHLCTCVLFRPCAMSSVLPGVCLPEFKDGGGLLI